MANMIEYRGYHGKIEFSAEDNLLVGHVVGIQDSLNFHGSSIQEATASFRDSIDGYLQMCEALGRKPDKEYRGCFNVRISPQLHRQAAIQAEAAGISMNQFVQEAIEEKLSPKREPLCIVMDTKGLIAASNNGFPSLETNKRYQKAISLS